MRALPFSYAALAALVLLAAGCGSSAKRLSKDEFITKADGICGAAQKGIPRIPASLGKNFDPATASTERLAAFGTYLQGVLTVFRNEVRELRKLHPPKDFQASYDSVLDLLDEGVKEGGEASAAARSGERAKVQAKLTESDDHFGSANKIARDYGLKVCGAG